MDGLKGMLSIRGSKCMDQHHTSRDASSAIIWSLRLRWAAGSTERGTASPTFMKRPRMGVSAGLGHLL